MNHTKQFCKIKQGKCTDKIIPQMVNMWADEIKFIVVDDTKIGICWVVIRNISKQDAGTYRCGVEGASSSDVTLSVKEDPCCGQLLIQTAHQGQNITLNCTHPEEYKSDIKYVLRVDNHSIRAVIPAVRQPEGKQKFSLLEHTQANMFSVGISDVTVEDGGLYLCGAQRQRESVTLYFPVFSEIQLHVTSVYLPGLHHSVLSLSLITVCVGVALLLTGALALVPYKLRCKRTQGSTASCQTRKNITIDGDYENDPSGCQNISMGSICQSLNPKSTLADSPYQSLNPNTTLADSIYQSLNPNTTLADSVYQ
ncbi:uncharacterized protein LOC113582853 isoform X2 [Electrophorus electricus]|nr:uncharacterized protein LOC113582853 isoform X2 [Electrophorus electricus]